MCLAAPFCKALIIFVIDPKSYASSLTWGHSNFIPWLLVVFFVPAVLTPCPALSPTSFCWRLITAWGNSILGMFCDLEILSLITAFAPEKESAESCPVSDCAPPWLHLHRGHFWLTGGWWGLPSLSLEEKWSRLYNLECLPRKHVVLHVLSSRRENTCLEGRLSCF